MTLSYVAAGTVATGTTSATPAAPSGIATGDLIVIAVGSKPDTAPVTQPSGWDLIGTAVGGTGSQGSGTGATRTTWFSRQRDATWSAMPSVAVSSGNAMWAQAYIVRTSVAGGDYDTSMATGARTTASTSWSVPLGSNPGFTTGDLVLFTGVTTSGALTVSSESISATGATFGTKTEISEPKTTTGNDVGGFVAWCMVTAGNATANATVTATMSSSTGATGVSAAVRIREAAPPAQDYSGTLARTGVGALTLDGDPGTEATLVRAGTGGATFGGAPLVEASVELDGSGALDMGGVPAGGADLSLAGEGTMSGGGVATQDAVVYHNSFDEGGEGLALNAGNSGASGDPITIVGGTGSLTYEAASALRGARGVRVVGAATQQAAIRLAMPVAAPSVSVQVLFRMNQVPSVASTTFLRVRTANATIVNVTLLATSVLQLRNNANATVKSSPTLAVGAVYRLQVQVTKGAGTTDGYLAYQLYDDTTGELVDSYSSGAADAGTLDSLAFDFGKITPANDTFDVSFDEPRIASTADPLPEPARIVSGSLDFTGTGAVSFGGTLAAGATLGATGSGSLQFGAAPAVAATLARTGTGAVGFVATPALGRTLALTGVGTAAFAGKPGGVGSLARTGAGTMTLSGAPRAAASLSLAGTGMLSVTGGGTGSASLATAGTGSLQLVTPGVTVSAASLVLAGAGGLSLAGVPRSVGALVLSGSGALVASGGLQTSGGLTRTGTGVVAFVPTALSQGGTLARAGTGDLSVGSRPQGTLTLSGTGALTLGGAPGGVRTMSRSGSGQLGLGRAGFGVQQTLPLTGDGTLSFAAAVAAAGILALSGAGELDAGGIPRPTGVLSLAGEGAARFEFIAPFEEVRDPGVVLSEPSGTHASLQSTRTGAALTLGRSRGDLTHARARAEILESTRRAVLG